MDPAAHLLLVARSLVLRDACSPRRADLAPVRLSPG